MSDREFNLDDLSRELSGEAEAAMLALILAWAHLDGALSQWVAQKFGISYPKLAVLLPRMDGEAKLLRLKRLYALDGTEGMVKIAGELKAQYAKWVKYRNTVAHSSCRGSLKSNPERIVFQTFEAIGPHMMVVETLHLDMMRQSTAWAERLSERIGAILEKAYEVKPHQPLPYRLTISWGDKP